MRIYTMPDIFETRSPHTSGVYSKRQVTIVRARRGVVDDQGREYIDCVGGQGTANLGHANAACRSGIAARR